MADRYDVCVPRPRKDGGTYWQKIGAAFPSKSGDGYQIILDALPLPDNEGRCVMSLFPAKPRDQQREAAPAQDKGLDDEIPF